MIKIINLTENTSFYLSATKKSKKKMSVTIICFCKNETFVFVNKRHILHFVVSHLLYGTPFRLKYCSVVYNVCSIKVCSSSPSVSDKSKLSSVRRFYL